MKKILKKIPSGFSLIELIVVMAIVSLLTTAGVAAYTGYLRNVRDTTRISDVALMNSIILNNIRLHGTIPTSIEEFTTTITAANNDRMIIDPLDKKVACLTSATDNTLDYCGYLYNTCDGGTGYVISTKFETISLAQKYTLVNGNTISYYRQGSCTSLDVPVEETVQPDIFCIRKIDCVTDSVCVGPHPKHCRLKTDQGVGASCDTKDDCATNKCKNKVCEAA